MKTKTRRQDVYPAKSTRRQSQISRRQNQSTSLHSPKKATNKRQKPAQAPAQNSRKTPAEDSLQNAFRLQNRENIRAQQKHSGALSSAHLEKIAPQTTRKSPAKRKIRENQRVVFVKSWGQNKKRKRKNETVTSSIKSAEMPIFSPQYAHFPCFSRKIKSGSNLAPTTATSFAI